MPKDGLSPKEWFSRLRQYAAGKFEFGTGQKPKSGKWKQELNNIEACPRHPLRYASSLGQSTLPGTQTVNCVCKYHVVNSLKTRPTLK